MSKRHMGLAMAAVAFGGLLVSAQAPQAPAAPAPQEQGAGPAAGGGGRAAGQPGVGRQGGGRQGGGRGAQQRRRKVLLAWADTRNGQAQHAFTSHALAVVERLGYDSGLWDTFIRTDSHIIYNQALKTDGTPASGGPSLSNVDGIFFLGHREIEFNARQKEELLAFVRSGKGFVAAHTGLTAFESWPEFGEMVGAQYGGHLYTGPGQVINERPDHPIVKHWSNIFIYDDEFYRPKGLMRDKVDVLLRFSPSNAPAAAKLPIDGDFPLVWTKTYGEGRVVYSSFSHAPEAWDIRNLQLMMFEAIRWSLGLTDAPVVPHPITAVPPPTDVVAQ
jgi:type 1 glutamine amidotransferase